MPAQSILVDNEQLEGSWEVVEDRDSENAFDAFYPCQPSQPGQNVDSAASAEFELRDTSVEVPQSNEWETQASSLVSEAPVESDIEHRVKGNFFSEQSQEWNNVGASDSMEDEMIGVSDEPWFSPVSDGPQDTTTPQATDVDDFSSDDALEFIDQDDPFAVSDQPEPVRYEVKVEEEEEEDYALGLEPSAASGTEDEEFLPMNAAEIGLRTNELLPSDLLGNSKSLLRRKRSSPVETLLSIFGGGMAAIPISILLMWYGLGKDPLEAGPVVARIAPWIVPERFQGSQAALATNLPETPAVIEPAATIDESTATMKFPPLGGGPALPSTFQAEVPLDATIPSNADERLATSSTDTSQSTPTTSSSNDTLTSAESTDRDSMIERSLSKIKWAIVSFDKKSPETGAMLLHSLEEFGEQLVAQPGPSSSNSDWHSKADESLKAIATNSDILFSFKNLIQSDRQVLLLEESLETQKQLVSIDVVEVKSVQENQDHAVWQLANRFQTQTSLTSLPVVAPQSLALAAQPGNLFLVIGLLTNGDSSEPPAFKLLFAMRLK